MRANEMVNKGDMDGLAINIDENIIALVRRFGETLDGALGRLNCFHVQGVQIEGWLKGEMLFFLDGEKKKAAIADFDREVRILVGDKRKQVDLRLLLEYQGDRHDVWVEVKHWTLQQKGTAYRPQFYFGDNELGIRQDVNALSKVPSGLGYCLILMTANPGFSDWQAGVDKFNEKFPPLSIVSLTNPREFPDAYHLGLLKVGCS